MQYLMKTQKRGKPNPRNYNYFEFSQSGACSFRIILRQHGQTCMLSTLPSLTTIPGKVEIPCNSAIYQSGFSRDTSILSKIILNIVRSILISDFISLKAQNISGILPTKLSPQQYLHNAACDDFLWMIILTINEDRSFFVNLVEEQSVFVLFKATFFPRFLKLHLIFIIIEDDFFAKKAVLLDE